MLYSISTVSILYFTVLYTEYFGRNCLYTERTKNQVVLCLTSLYLTARPCGFAELFGQMLGTTYPKMSKIGPAVPKLWPKMWAPGPQIRQGTFCLLRFMQLYWACTAGLVRFWANLRRPQKPPYLPKPQNHENGVSREGVGLLTRAKARQKAEHNAVSLVPPA